MIKHARFASTRATGGSAILSYLLAIIMFLHWPEESENDAVPALELTNELSSQLRLLTAYIPLLNINLFLPFQKQGAFVWREIKPARGMLVPEGAAALMSTQGSEPLEQPQAEKGNRMTSPCLCLPDSQETPDSDTGLSKTDISVEAKADLSASEKGLKSGGISQKDKVDLGCPAKRGTFLSSERGFPP
ncbi:UNVERIFIED_CONTAM: hypothetical protein K2H54_039179 [Gekko kuhli]